MSKVEYSGIGRLPANVTGFFDRHGKARFRFRKRGFPVYYFKSQPGTDEFQAELAACRLARAPQGPRASGLRRPLVEQRLAEHSRWAESSRTVYFIGSEVGPLKIGLSDCVGSRLANLQACSPVRLTLLASTLGGAKLEREYHARFSAHRLHGEWFSPAPDILAEIERLNGKTA